MTERPTEGMPDMMPKGTIDNPPQKQPQNIPLRMVDEPYEGPETENPEEDKDVEKDSVVQNDKNTENDTPDVREGAC
ncbi:MAG: hypothetical protein LUG18_10675 [Candidatus Azobacteroides sp.]|nr:hypothetical protein [Candidatus Azobacteroides sp.]